MNVNQVLGKVAPRPSRKRRGRGEGSGIGGTAGRGNKGAKSRSGWRRRYGYEGGQMPLSRRVPKRGFSNALFKDRYDVINVAQLQEHFAPGEKVDPQTIERKLGMKYRCGGDPARGGLKVLGDGELTKNLDVTAHRFSASAKRKIEACGGTCTLIDPSRVVVKRPPVPPRKPAQKASPQPAEKSANEKPPKEKPAKEKPAKEKAAPEKGASKGTQKEPRQEPKPKKSS